MCELIFISFFVKDKTYITDIIVEYFFNNCIRNMIVKYFFNNCVRDMNVDYFISNCIKLWINFL